MKAAYIEQVGPPETIHYGEVPDPPDPTGSQVLVEVKAVAVNPVDTYIRSGLVPMKLPKRFIVGCDLAGVVRAVGPEVTRFEPGDRVWGSNQGLLGRQGTFAEKVLVDECWLYPIPENVSFEDAAAMALVGITAHLGLVKYARLQSGETIFVNGGSGAVGSTVIQMARALGARPYASAGTPEKVTLCQEFGAQQAFNYREQHLAQELKKVLPAGVNVWWETSREPDFDLAVGALASHGRLILMAGREARPPFPVGPFYVKGCSMHGFVMFMEHPDDQREAAEDINRWMAEGLLKPRIAHLLPLSEAAKAHQIQEDATIHKKIPLAGKIVLKPTA